MNEIQKAAFKPLFSLSLSSRQYLEKATLLHKRDSPLLYLLFTLTGGRFG